MKILIFDSGTLINLSMNGLLYILEEFKKVRPDVRFVITKQVKYEVLDRPMSVPRFELGALRIESLIQDKILELPNFLEIDEKEIEKETKILMEAANNLIADQGRPIKIVADAEMSCLALSKVLTGKKIENMIAVDERTTRILSEKPENLENLMSRRIHKNVKLTTKDFSKFSKFRFMRSTELVYAAHKLGILHITGPKALEAVLYATKFKGASVSWDEIKELKKLRL